MLKRSILWGCLVGFGCVTAVTGCDLAGELVKNVPPSVVDELDPDVTLSPPTLRRSPTLLQLGAYYCPSVIKDPLVSIGCAVALGSPPPKSTLEFEFNLPLKIANPNNIPVPTLDVLVAMTVFDGAAAQEVGALCVSMCTDDTPDCDGKPRDASACTDDEQTITSVDDIVGRLPGLISDILTGKALDELKKWQVPQGGDVNLDLSFTLGIDPAINIFEKVALKYVQDLLSGTDSSMAVPISGHGAVFFKLPIAGRIGVNYGPVKGVWNID